MFNYILERAKEPSTWRGLVLLATAGGVNIAPEMATSVIEVGIAVAGLLGIITKDKR